MDLTKNLLAASLIFVAACSDAPVVDDTAGESQPVRWKMTSTFPSSLIQLGTMGKRFSEQIKKVSGGNIEIRFFEPGALAPALEGFDAVSYGAIEAGWSTSGYWAGKELGLQLFGSVPFGPDAPEYLAWFILAAAKRFLKTFTTSTISTASYAALPRPKPRAGSRTRSIRWKISGAKKFVSLASAPGF